MPEDDVQQLARGACAPADETTLLRLPVEIDLANAAGVTEDLRAAVDQGTAVVIADMSATRFCDCAGVSALLSAGRDAANRGAELRIAARAAAVLRVFELTGVLTTLRVDPSVARAAGARRSGPAAPGYGHPVIFLRR